MSEEKQKEIAEIVENLKELDNDSMLILNSGAQMLKARQDGDKKDERVA